MLLLWIGGGTVGIDSCESDVICGTRVSVCVTERGRERERERERDSPFTHSLILSFFVF